MGKIRYNKIGEYTNHYNIKAINPFNLSINGNIYKVDYDNEFTIKILKTKIKAVGGATQLAEFLLHETNDYWECKILESCKPRQ